MIGALIPNLRDSFGLRRGSSKEIVSSFMEEVVEHGTFDQKKLVDLWQKSSGLHTVEEWVVNYNKHPAGWGALLMIHGSAEVTGRLRSKVQNYAMYAVLFLAMSLTAALEQDPENMSTQCHSTFSWLPQQASAPLCGILA